LHMSAPALTPPEIERRTLPGRTVITGVALPDVASVTLTTPSDVRTLRPSGPRHVLIAVYDGAFYQGLSSATIRLRDGHTLTEPVGNGVLGGGNRPSRPSFTRLLYLLERRHQLAPRSREPTGELVQVIRRRIAYEHAHPGLLPRQ
jgi:hypothetical protein